MAVIQMPGKAPWARGAELMQERTHQRERRGGPKKLKPGHPVNLGLAPLGLFSLY